MTVVIKIQQVGDFDELVGLDAGRDASLSVNAAKSVTDAPRVASHNPVIFKMLVQGITQAAEVLVEVRADWTGAVDPDTYIFNPLEINFDAVNGEGEYYLDLGHIFGALLNDASDDARDNECTIIDGRVSRRMGVTIKVTEAGVTTTAAAYLIAYASAHQVGDPAGAGELRWKQGNPPELALQEEREFYYYLEDIRDSTDPASYELRNEDTGAALTTITDVHPLYISRSAIRVQELKNARHVGAYLLPETPTLWLEGGKNPSTPADNWDDTRWLMGGGTQEIRGGLNLPAGGTLQSLQNAATASYYRGDMLVRVKAYGVSLSNPLLLEQLGGGSLQITSSGWTVAKFSNVNAAAFVFSNTGAGDVKLVAVDFASVRSELLDNPNFRSSVDANAGDATGWALSAGTSTSKAAVLASGGLTLYGLAPYAEQDAATLENYKTVLRYYVRENSTPAGSASAIEIRVLTDAGDTVYGSNSAEVGEHQLQLDLPEQLNAIRVTVTGDNTDNSKGIILDMVSLIGLEIAPRFEMLQHTNLEDGSTTFPAEWSKYDDGSYRHVDKQADGVKLTADADNRLAAIYQECAGVKAGDLVRATVVWESVNSGDGLDIQEGATILQSWTFNHNDTARHTEVVDYVATQDGSELRVANANAGAVIVHSASATQAPILAPELRQISEYEYESPCAGEYELKWLDDNGIYRFGTFSSYSTASQKVGKPVQTDNYIDQLSSAVARRATHNRSLSASLELHKRRVPSAVWEHYKSLSASPKVYLQVDAERWREVVIAWNAERQSDRNFHDIDITVALGDLFTQHI